MQQYSEKSSLIRRQLAQLSRIDPRATFTPEEIEERHKRFAKNRFLVAFSSSPPKNLPSAQSQAIGPKLTAPLLNRTVFTLNTQYYKNLPLSALYQDRLIQSENEQPTRTIQKQQAAEQQHLKDQQPAQNKQISLPTDKLADNRIELQPEKLQNFGKPLKTDLNSSQAGPNQFESQPSPINHSTEFNLFKNNNSMSTLAQVNFPFQNHSKPQESQTNILALNLKPISNNIFKKDEETEQRTTVQTKPLDRPNLFSLNLKQKGSEFPFGKPKVTVPELQVKDTDSHQLKAQNNLFHSNLLKIAPIIDKTGNSSHMPMFPQPITSKLFFQANQSNKPVSQQNKPNLQGKVTEQLFNVSERLIRQSEQVKANNNKVLPLFDKSAQKIQTAKNVNSLPLTPSFSQSITQNPVQNSNSNSNESIFTPKENLFSFNNSKPDNTVNITPLFFRPNNAAQAIITPIVDPPKQNTPNIFNSNPINTLLPKQKKANITNLFAQSQSQLPKAESSSVKLIEFAKPTQIQKVEEVKQAPKQLKKQRSESLLGGIGPGGKMFEIPTTLFNHVNNDKVADIKPVITNEKPNSKINNDPFKSTSGNLFSNIQSNPGNIFMSQPVTTNLFSQPPPSTNIFGQPSSTNIFGQPSLSTNLFSQPSGLLFGGGTSLQNTSPNIFGNMENSIFSKENEQQPVEQEDKGEEGEDDDEPLQAEDEANPNLSTGSYDYIKTDILFKEAANKFRQGAKETLQNVVVSVERFDGKSDKFLFVRMSNKCIAFSGKILMGVTESRVLNSSSKNVEVKKILLCGEHVGKPELTLLKLQFKDQASGAKFLKDISAEKQQN